MMEEVRGVEFIGDVEKVDGVYWPNSVNEKLDLPNVALSSYDDRGVLCQRSIRPGHSAS